MSKKKKPDGRRNNRPPAEHQWVQGQSGNPAGRPRKRRNTWREDLREFLATEVELNVTGTKKRYTAQQGIFWRLIGTAINGNQQAIRTVLALMQMVDEVPEFTVLPEDEAIMEGLMKKYPQKEGKDED